MKPLNHGFKNCRLKLVQNKLNCYRTGVASFSSFRNIKNHYLTAAEATADIDDSIKRKRIRASLDYSNNINVL